MISKESTGHQGKILKNILRVMTVCQKVGWKDEKSEVMVDESHSDISTFLIFVINFYSSKSTSQC